MFCEKCGNQLPEDAKFCANCGAMVEPDDSAAPATAAPVVEAPAAPVAETPVVEAPAAPVAETPVVEQPFQPVQQPAQPVAPKKNIWKILIPIIAGSVALILVLVLVFAVIVPAFNKTKVKDYIEFSIDESVLYEGYISADVSIDTETLLIDKVLDGKNFDYDDIDSWTSLGSAYGNSYYVSQILEYCNIEARIKDAVVDEESEDSISYGDTYDTVENLKSTDTVVVEITWDQSESAKKTIKNAQKKSGIKFDTSDATVEFSVQDELEAAYLTVQEATEVDILGYIQEQDLVYTEGFEDGDLRCKIDEFEYEAEGYTFKHSDGYSSIYIYDSEGDSVGSVYLNTYMDDESCSNYYLSTGDVITFTLNDGVIEDIGLVFTKDSFDYTVKANTYLTADECKTNINLIKTALNEQVDETKNVVSAYFLKDKTGDAYYDNIVCLITKETQEDRWTNEKETVYKVYYFRNAYMQDGEFCYSYYSNSYSSYEDVKSAVERDYYISDDGYTSTKVLG